MSLLQNKQKGYVMTYQQKYMNVAATDVPTRQEHLGQP